MLKLFIYVILLLFLASCEEQSDWNLQTAGNDFIVVDGIVTNELKIQSITLSKPVAKLNEKPEPVRSATVLISSNLANYSFHENPAQPGTYLSDKEFTGIRNRTYSLNITSDTKVYTSKAVLAPSADFVFLKHKKIAVNKYQITTVSLFYNPDKAAFYEIFLDWSTAAGYTNQNPDSCKAKLFYYTLPTLDVSEVFAPAIEKVTFPAGTVITERRYSLTDEHASFIRALLLETTWQGGLFNTASANVPTNMSEGAFGYFGACGVTEKTETVK
jgi:hypothetical protein